MDRLKNGPEMEMAMALADTITSSAKRPSPRSSKFPVTSIQHFHYVCQALGTYHRVEVSVVGVTLESSCLPAPLQAYRRSVSSGSEGGKESR